MVAGFSSAEMAQMMSQNPRSTLPRDEKELASRLGVDPQIVTLVGGWGKLARLVSGPQWSKYSETMPSRGLSLRASASSWAFRSWANKTEHFDSRIHKKVVGRVAQSVLLYIYAANGAGKTYLCERERSWVDMDTISSKYAAGRPMWIGPEANTNAKKLFAGRMLHEAIKEGYKVLIGQWSSAMVVEIGAAMGITIHVVHYEPGVELREERLRKRGYDETAIQRLRQRWEYAEGAYATAEALQARINFELGKFENKN